MTCRLCNSKNLSLFLDLGHHPPSDQFVKKERLNNEFAYYPLKVNICNNCKFHQLNYVVKKEILYDEEYPYESSQTKVGNQHFNNFANSVIKKYKLDKKDLVVDIGSNIGVLLNGFKKNKIQVLGIEPASNICKIAKKKGINTYCSFFNNNIVNKIITKFGKAKIVTATNVFAHIDDLQNFTKSICRLLDKKGAFIIEAPHFLNLIKKIEYDTIYHEHLSYITIKPLISFFSKFKLEIIDVEKKDIHGGSVRIHVAFKNQHTVNKNVKNIIKEEKNAKLDSKKVLENFSQEVKKNRSNLILLLTKLKLNNKTIVAVSAPAKGMTLLNYCKIDKTYLDFATEKSKLKQNTFAPGAHIPVTSDSKLLSQKIDYALLLAWNFSKEIINNNVKFMQNGGKFIIPIPKIKIIDKKNYKKVN